MGNRSFEFLSKLGAYWTDNLKSTRHIHHPKALNKYLAKHCIARLSLPSLIIIDNTQYVTLRVYLISPTHYIANFAMGAITQSLNPTATLQKHKEKKNNGGWTFKATDQRSAPTSI